MPIRPGPRAICEVSTPKPRNSATQASAMGFEGSTVTKRAGTPNPARETATLASPRQRCHELRRYRKRLESPAGQARISLRGHYCGGHFNLLWGSGNTAMASRANEASSDG